MLKVDGRSLTGFLCLSWSRILPSVLGIAEWLFYDCVGRTGVQGCNASARIEVLRDQIHPRHQSRAPGSKQKPWVVGPEALGSGEDEEH